jgi:regulator of PEP synthase PpsR (kinase-PPPase family)
MEMTKRTIYIVSDASGQTCERVVKAVLTQFEYQDVQLHLWPYVRTPEAVEKVVRAASADNGIVVYTLVGAEERKRMAEIAGKLSVNTVDLLGPILDKFTGFFSTDPKEIPGLFQVLITEEP